MYHIKLEKFEGPLDLLYRLIEGKKLEITEISLAQVAGQFLAYLKSLSRNNVNDLADFLVVAGRLVLIKSKALLPSLDLTDDEESDIESLKQQLAEYYKYRRLAQDIHKLDLAGKIRHSRAYLCHLEPIFYFPRRLNASDLASSVKNILNTITLPQRIPQAQAIDVISLERKLEELENIIKEKVELRFCDLLKTPKAEEKVIAFLSVLELIKSNRVLATQKNNFEEIKLLWQN